jgi:hypothetical protein
VTAFDLSIVGFSEKELQALADELDAAIRQVGEDCPPDPPAEAISRPGDIWELGNHRLLCGDSTEPACFEQLLGAEAAAMTFTDAPYNVNYGATSGKSIANDNLGEGFGAFLESACRNILRHTNGAVYLCMSSSELHPYTVLLPKPEATGRPS